MVCLSCHLEIFLPPSLILCLAPPLSSSPSPSLSLESHGVPLEILRSALLLPLLDPLMASHDAPSQRAWCEALIVGYLSGLFCRETGVARVVRSHERVDELVLHGARERERQHDKDTQH